MSNARKKYTPEEVDLKGQPLLSESNNSDNKSSVEIKIAHNDLPSENNKKLMSDTQFSKVSNRAKTSIKDGILGDLGLIFDDISSEHLSLALQIMMLRNPQLHGLISFSENRNTRNPFVVQRSEVDDFFRGVSSSVGNGIRDCNMMGGCDMGGCGGEGAMIVCGCVIVGAVCCGACWGAAKSVEVVARTNTTVAAKVLKLLFAFALAGGSAYLLEHFAGKTFGGLTKQDEGTVGYKAGEYGIPVMAGLLLMMLVNCTVGRAEPRVCVPTVDVPQEDRQALLVAYGNELYKKLEIQLGSKEKADKLLTDLNDSTIPGYFTTYPDTKSGDIETKKQMVLFAREVITQWINTRKPQLANAPESKSTSSSVSSSSSPSTMGIFGSIDILVESEEFKDPNNKQSSSSSVSNKKCVK